LVIRPVILLIDLNRCRLSTDILHLDMAPAVRLELTIGHCVKFTYSYERLNLFLYNRYSLTMATFVI